MFHVEHLTKKRAGLLDNGFWRGGASAKVKFLFYGVTCAKIRAKAMNVKSFLRVWCKLFTIV
jgi:hypothetical protein